MSDLAHPLASLSVKELKEKGANAAAAASPAAVAESHKAEEVEEEEEEEEIFFEIPEFHELERVLLDESAPIAQRMRTAFLLKQLGDQPSLELLAKGLRSASVLLGHECGYVLGQMQNPAAIPLLEEILRDRSVNAIVRHECAEALGAIGDPSALALLKEFSTDESEEVRETCVIALEKIAWNQANPGVSFPSKYASVDPAPRTDDPQQSVEELQKQLMDTSLSHFQRYRAMFALRDRDSEEAVKALATGFQDKSALFRHEVAYVMGQIAHPASIDSLKEVTHTTLTHRTAEALSNESEHPMVRHEAAEALGSIADEALTAYLQDYQKGDKDRIVRESCDVALDMVDYWNNDEVSTAVDPTKAQ